MVTNKKFGLKEWAAIVAAIGTFLGTAFGAYSTVGTVTDTGMIIDKKIAESEKRTNEILDLKLSLLEKDIKYIKDSVDDQKTMNRAILSEIKKNAQ